MALDNSVLKFSDLIGSDETFDEIITNIRLVKKELQDLAKVADQKFSIINPNDEKAIEAAIKDVNEWIKAKKLLDEQEKLAAKTKKKLKDLTEEELILREKQKIENRERVQRAKQLAILQKAEVGSIEALRAELSLTTLKWKKLGEAERQSTKEGKDLVKQKKRLTEELKRLEKQTGDTRRNVGNYTSSLGKLGKVAASVFVGRSIVDGIRRMGQAIGTLIDRNKDSDKSIAALDDSLGGFKNTLLDAGGKLLSFVAKPLTAVIKGITRIIKVFSGFPRATTQIKGFTATSKALVGVTKKINQEFAKEKGTVDRLFTSLRKTNKGSNERKNLLQSINRQYGKYLPNLLNEKSTLNEIVVAQRLINEEMTKQFALKIQNATQTDIFTNKIKAQNESFEDLRKKFRKVSIEVDASFNPAFGELVEQFNKATTLYPDSDESKLISELFTGWGYNVERFAKKVDVTNPKLANLARLINKFKMAVGSDSREFFFLEGLIKGLANKTDKYNAAAADSSAIINQLSKGLITNNTVTSTNTKEVIDNTKAIKGNKNARIKGIESLQKELQDLEINNIKDTHALALRLEELRYIEEKKLRDENFEDYKKTLKKEIELRTAELDKNSKEFIKIKQEEADEILKIDTLAKNIKEEADIKHYRKIADINQKFMPKAPELPPPPIEDEDLIDEEIRNEIGLLSERQKRERDFNRMLTDEKIKSIKDENKRKIALELEHQKRKREDILSNEKLTWEQKQQLLEQLDKQEANSKKSLEEEKTKELFNRISEISQKITSELQNAFNQQSAFMDKLVQDQSNAVEAQRKRADQGLNNSLKFEQKELAKREAEQIRAEQRAKQAAEIITLYNLVSAYAASGDKNALERGLIDFSILKALSEGFQEGGYTGDAATDTISGHVHGQEYVVTAKDTKKFGLAGKSGDQFGEAMSDYFKQTSPLLNNNFREQRSNFEGAVQVVNNNVDFGGLQSEFVKLRKTFERIPRTEVDVVWLTDYVIQLTEKTIRGKMTKVNQQKRRLNGRY